MSKLVTALILLLLAFGISLAFCNVPVYAGPTLPPTPPTISIAVESADCESIKFLVEIQPRNNTLSNFQIEYRIADSSTILVKKVMLIKTPEGLYQGTYHVVVAGLPPDTPIHYRVVLAHNSGSVATAETETRTDPLPTMSVSLTHTYSEGLSLTIRVSPNGNNVRDVRIEYYTPTSNDWSIATGEEVSENVYHVSISDLSPQTLVHYWGAMHCLTHQDMRYIAQPESEVMTNTLPAIRVIEKMIGFNKANIMMEVMPNNNPIYTSYLEYQLPEINVEWKTYANPDPDMDSFIAYLTNLSPNQTVHFRGGLTYMTGGLNISKVIQSDTYVIKTNSVSTGDYQPEVKADKSTVNYRLNGTFMYSKRNPDDFTHFDLGFIWSENANPILNSSSHQLSLGWSSLPVDYTDASFAFSASATGLRTGTTYYYRSYVIGENNQIFYGNVKTCFLPKMTPGPTPTKTDSINPTTTAGTNEGSAASSTTAASGEVLPTNQTSTGNGQTSAVNQETASPGFTSSTTGSTGPGGPASSTGIVTGLVVALAAALLALAGGAVVMILKKGKK